MERIDVLLVDDQILFVESFKTILEIFSKDINVIGIAHNGWEAIKLAEKLNPHIILMDVRMPGMDGVEATRIIHDKYPDMRIMMLTTFDDDVYVQEALNNGAVGYLLKDTLPKDVILSIHALAHGTYQISHNIAAKLINKAYQFSKNTANSKNLPFWYRSISKREKEVLSLIVMDYNNQEIAEKLFIAEQTVKNHVSMIYSKLDANDRTHIKNIVADSNISL